MKGVILTVVLLCTPLATVAADDYKLSQLDQDLRELRRQVQDQQRQIDALRAQLPAPPARSPSAQPAVPVPRSDAWIDAARWQRIQAGMGELEVVGVLGPPTSMRSEGAERILLYAIEIGSAGFLSGSVTLRDRVVVDVQKPVLR